MWAVLQIAQGNQNFEIISLDQKPDKLLTGENLLGFYLIYFDLFLNILHCERSL